MKALKRCSCIIRFFPKVGIKNCKDRWLIFLGAVLAFQNTPLYPHFWSSLVPLIKPFNARQYTLHWAFDRIKGGPEFTRTQHWNDQHHCKGYMQQKKKSFFNIKIFQTGEKPKWSRIAPNKLSFCNSSARCMTKRFAWSHHQRRRETKALHEKSLSFFFGSILHNTYTYRLVRSPGFVHYNLSYKELIKPLNFKSK